MTAERGATKRPRIDLVYFEGCPNVEAARENLGQALRSLELAGAWTEWVQGGAETPEWAASLPSPTVLVDRLDVIGSSRTTGPACAAEGAPSVEAIERALSEQGAAE